LYLTQINKLSPPDLKNGSLTVNSTETKTKVPSSALTLSEDQLELSKILRSLHHDPSLLGCKVHDLGGQKWLYAHAYYTEEEFNEV
jgi:hypothetical protein